MVHDFVLAAALDRAGYVFTVMEPIMCDTETVEKVKLFYRTGLQVNRMLSDGTEPENLKNSLREKYPNGFWHEWGGYRGAR
ncbi:hypothetical protein MASR2M78_03820 [Treponema sp.]